MSAHIKEGYATAFGRVHWPKRRPKPTIRCLAKMAADGSVSRDELADVCRDAMGRPDDDRILEFVAPDITDERVPFARWLRLFGAKLVPAESPVVVIERSEGGEA